MSESLLKSTLGFLFCGAAGVGALMYGTAFVAELNRTQEPVLYPSVENCLSARFYSEATCRKGGHITPGSATIEAGPFTYESRAECTEAGFYSPSTCNKFQSREEKRDGRRPKDNGSGSWNVSPSIAPIAGMGR